MTLKNLTGGEAAEAAGLDPFGMSISTHACCEYSLREAGVGQDARQLIGGGEHRAAARARPVGDWDDYYLRERRLTWTPNKPDQPKAVSVPIGFVADLTGTPSWLWPKLRPEGRYAYAAIVHDYLYWTQERPREEADLILKLAMEDSKVDAATVRIIYDAVRAAGGSAWKKNAELKQGGEKRILKSFPSDFTVSWSAWKKQPGVFSD